MTTRRPPEWRNRGRFYLDKETGEMVEDHRTRPATTSPYVREPSRPAADVPTRQ